MSGFRTTMGTTAGGTLTQLQTSAGIPNYLPFWASGYNPFLATPGGVFYPAAYPYHLAPHHHWWMRNNANVRFPEKNKLFA